MRYGVVIEAPFALFDEELEMLPWDAVVAPQTALGLVSKVLDAVDVVALVGEQRGVVDPHMAELRDVEHIVAPEGIGIDHGAGEA